MALRPVALLWDVDGTLAETEDQGHRPAFNQAFRDAGLPWQWDSDLYHRLLAVSGGRERMARFLKDREGRTPDAALLDELVERKQSHYLRLVRQGCCALRPGVSRLLQEAAAAGLPQAIVTTSSRRAVKALAEGVLGQELGPVFAFWICGEDVAVKKPDPSAYTLAVERLGLPAATLLPRTAAGPAPPLSVLPSAAWSPARDVQWLGRWHVAVPRRAPATPAPRGLMASHRSAARSRARACGALCGSLRRSRPLLRRPAGRI